MVASQIEQNTQVDMPAIPRRQFGNTDLHVSEFGIGCQSFGGGLFRPVDRDVTRTILRRAFDQGVTDKRYRTEQGNYYLRAPV